MNLQQKLRTRQTMHNLKLNYSSSSTSTIQIFRTSNSFDIQKCGKSPSFLEFLRNFFGSFRLSVLLSVFKTINGNFIANV